MSDEELKVNSNNEEKKTCCKENSKETLLIILVVISLIFSIISATVSIISLNNGGGSVGNSEGKKVVISKQYDKGKTFAKAKATGKPVLVFFYTDWCGFCQRFAPTYDKISKDKLIKKNVAVAYVNCEDAKNHKLMEEYNVEGFPTVYVVKPDGTKTHLDNNTFFQDDSKTIVRDNVLEVIAE